MRVVLVGPVHRGFRGEGGDEVLELLELAGPAEVQEVLFVAAVVGLLRVVLHLC